MSDLVDEQKIRDNNTVQVDKTKTPVYHPPRDNQFGVIYVMPTTKQTSNATLVITQDDEESSSTIDNKPRTYANNMRTKLL